jgi:hypothetical protein
MYSHLTKKLECRVRLLNAEIVTNEDCDAMTHMKLRSSSLAESRISGEGMVETRNHVGKSGNSAS